MSRIPSVTEPHPTVPKSGGYLTAGRGGAGNFSRYNYTDLTPGPNATGPASRISLLKTSASSSSSSRPPKTLSSGRGGAGNMFKPSHSDHERVFQFDEEMLKRRESEAPVYHFGRGGMANFKDERRKEGRSGNANVNARRESQVSVTSSAASERSSGSERVRSVVERVTRRF